MEKEAKKRRVTVVDSEFIDTDVTLFIPCHPLPCLGVFLVDIHFIMFLASHDVPTTLKPNQIQQPSAPMSVSIAKKMLKSIWPMPSEAQYKLKKERSVHAVFLT
jgi:hypothetical protein